MAYLRRNHKYVQLVVSKRINGKPRIKILQVVKMRSDLKSLPAEFRGKGEELFDLIENPSVPALIGNIQQSDLTKPISKAKKDQIPDFDGEAYLRVIDDYEAGKETERLVQELMKRRKDLQQFATDALFHRFFFSLEEKGSVTKKQFEELKLTAFGPKGYKGGEKYPHWALCRIKTVWGLSEAIHMHRFSLNYAHTFNEPDHLRYRAGRVENLDLLIKAFCAWAKKIK